DLYQRMRQTFARNGGGDTRVLGLAGDLVQLVDVDDAALALGDVEVSGLEQPHEDVLNVFADITRFGERGRVGDGEGDVEDSGERLSEKSFADARWAEEQDIALIELDFVVSRVARVDSFVVIVDRNRERLFRVFLTDDV